MLLKKIVNDFDIIIPKVDENSIGTPDIIAKNNAILKGEAIIDSENIIIACDTLVALDGEIFEKPNNYDNAFVMLKKLQAKTHSVFSGVYMRNGSKVICFVEESKVSIKPLNDMQIKKYLLEYKPFDKAGAYGIQDGIIVDEYLGSYDNIVGLPTEKLSIALRKILE